ncbi:hypothetical protein DV515_00014031 [Chloebia gouldiae]|uniref:Uncharacterized protein n=1 Tax=Chloebia gouldiae TaxID=44316 RepID=A0A3L8RZJ9_CHLGU|nr:hypothetical protein DV515_00014031 [Chloebia gouldiae]
MAAALSAMGLGALGGSGGLWGTLGVPVQGGELWVWLCLTEVFPAAAEAEAEDRYRSSVRGASLCRGSLRTPRPEEGAAGSDTVEVPVRLIPGERQAGDGTSLPETPNPKMV